MFGDHGMTSTGDHGGQTLQETEAALLVYSKRSLFGGKQVLYMLCAFMTLCMKLLIPANH